MASFGATLLPHEAILPARAAARLGAMLHSESVCARMPRLGVRSFLRLIIVVLITATDASAYVLVSEGVTYSPATRDYTYRYAIDNRNGTRGVGEIGILVFARNGAVPFLPEIPHTSPEGWTFRSGIGNAFGPCCGVFELWQSETLVQPGQYLSGFSLISPNGPDTAVPGTNSFVLGPPYADIFEVGIVPAPGIAETTVPMFSFSTAVLLALTLALVALRTKGLWP
jgi:hypothetical protein